MSSASLDITTPVFVTESEELNRLCEGWQKLSVLALDTEFIRVDTFFPRLGLVQVCDGEHSYLLDPLSLSDWSSFSAVLKNPTITKVLHSCSEDLVVFRQFFGQLPQPLFDTQRAASFLDFGYSISYQNLVKQVLGREISKGETRSDWLRRPLSPEQMSYAALDVAYLPEIASILRIRLEEKKYSLWLDEDCKQMLSAAYQDDDAEEWRHYYLSMGAAWRLAGRQLEVLQRLCLWREQEARRRNKPRNWIAKDTDLMLLAEKLPVDKRALSVLSDLTRSLLYQHASAILAVIAEPHQGPPLTGTAIDQPLSSEQKMRLKKCQEIVRLKAEEMGIAPELLARRKQLLPLLTEHARQKDFEWPLELSGWRQQLLELDLRIALQ